MPGIAIVRYSSNFTACCPNREMLHFAQHDMNGNDENTEDVVILMPLLRQKNLNFGFGQHALQC